MRVLVREPIADAGLALLQSRFEVDVDESSPLESVIGDYDAIIIRSATKLSADLIEKGTRLRVIGGPGWGSTTSTSTPRPGRGSSWRTHRRERRLRGRAHDRVAARPRAEHPAGARGVA